MTQFQAVVAMSTRRLVGKADFVQDGIHEITGTITRERSAGSIGTMRSGSKPKNKNTGLGVAKP
jgi:hypothetical protein